MNIKRLFDLIIAIILCIIFLIPFLVIAIAIKISSAGPIIFWSNRIGRNNIIFQMPKFRTMLISAPIIATNNLKNPKQYLTPIGSLLRRSSLDELPQLWSVLKGEMTFVGPRPALFNQYDLIALRAKVSVDQLLPGVTGWAQINGRDELSIMEKTELDVFYLKHKSFWFDCKIMGLTLLKVVNRDGVSH
jgi:O-antigen biosynthesis protein WbqP